MQLYQSHRPQRAATRRLASDQISRPLPILIYELRINSKLALSLHAMLSFSSARARVAQWIRAFASGAKGRRFDPCRGYQYLPNSSTFFMDHTVSIRRGEALPTILIVEDFDDTRLMMKMWLTRHGYRVLEAETGEEGVA